VLLHLLARQSEQSGRQMAESPVLKTAAFSSSAKSPEELFAGADLSLFFVEENDEALKRGQPIFFIDGPTIFPEPTLFINENYVALGGAPSKDALNKRGYQLKSWFEFCQSIGVYWANANAETRRLFRDAYTEAISPKTGRPYDLKGVKDAMVVIQKFYQYCRERGWYFGDIGTQSEQSAAPRWSQGTSDGQWKNTKARDRDLPKVPRSDKIHPLTVVNLRTLLHHVGPRASERGSADRLSRDRLAFDLGWVVGLRLAEIISLNALQFQSLNPDADTPLVDLSISVTGKNKKTRQVTIPTWLVLDALSYIDGERSEALNGMTKKATNQLLVVGTNATKNHGAPLGKDALQKVIRKACFDTGLLEKIEKNDTNSKQKFIAHIPKHSMHDLRHTYAVYQYIIEVKLGNPEPWKKIQSQLGHSALSTTIDTYLKHVQLFSSFRGVVDVLKAIKT